MPISSTEISNIIQSQVGMFSASAAYAQAVSAQYGYQSFGGMGVNDPRGSAQGAQAGLQAGAIGSQMARAPGYGAHAVSAMAMFGFGPRLLDPFTSTFNAASQGFARQGMGGALGMGAAAAGVYMGIGQAGAYATEHMVGGAQNRGMLNSQMSQMFPGMGARGMGVMAGQVEAQARMGMGNLREVTAVMQQGVHSGAVDTQTLTQFSQSFSKLMSNVRQVATVMNTSLQQAQQAMHSVSGMGVSGDQAAGFLGTMKSIGQAARISPQGMLGLAGAGAEFGRSTGIDPMQAATGAMVSAGVYGYTERNNLIKGISGEAQGRYTQAATRFLGSKQGRTVLGAMMTSEGQFDTGMASQMAAGALSWQEIQSAYNKNISGGRQRDMLSARGGEIAGQFISEFGPQSISGALKGAADQSQTPETLRRALTGLNRNDLQAMDMLASNTGQIRTRMLAEARAGFQEGQGQVGISQIVNMAIDKLTKPIRTKFQKLGANMAQYTQEAIEDVTNRFVVGGSTPGGITSMEKQEWRTGMSNLTQTGNKFAMDSWVNRMNMPGGRTTGFDWGGASSPQTMWGGFASRVTPSALQIGGMSPGTTLGELPGHGLGLSQYEPAQTAFAGASWMRGFGGGRNVFGATGAGMSRVGQHITGAGANQLGGALPGIFPSTQLPQGAPFRALRGGATGFMGFGGHGVFGGAGRFAGGSLRAGGLGLRAFGKVAGAVSTPMMAWDMVTNVGPASARAMGLAPQVGGITGDNARLASNLAQLGILPPGSVEERDSTAAMGDDIPIAGTFSHPGGFAGGQAGRQEFLTPDGRNAIGALMEEQGSTDKLGELYEQAGGYERVQGIISGMKSARNATSGKDNEMLLEFMRKAGVGRRAAYIMLGQSDAFKDDLAGQFSGGPNTSRNPEEARAATLGQLDEILGSGEPLAQGHHTSHLAGLLRKNLKDGGLGDDFERILGRARSSYERGGRSGTSDTIDMLTRQLTDAGIFGTGGGRINLSGAARREFAESALKDQLGAAPGGTGLQRGIDPASGHTARQYNIGAAVSKDKSQRDADERGENIGNLRIASWRAGYAKLNAFEGIQRTFERRTTNADGQVIGGSGEDQAMSDFAGMLVSPGDEKGLQISNSRLADLTTSFAGSNTAMGQRQHATAAAVQYYNKQWEGGSASPEKFLARISHNSDYNHLTRAERDFLRGKNAKGHTPRLEGMLEETARDMARAAGGNPTGAENATFADQLARGVAMGVDDDYTKQDLMKSITALYTPVRPSSNRGGSAAANDSVQRISTVLDRFADRIEALFPK